MFGHQGVPGGARGRGKHGGDTAQRTRIEQVQHRFEDAGVTTPEDRARHHQGVGLFNGSKCFIKRRGTQSAKNLVRCIAGDIADFNDPRAGVNAALLQHSSRLIQHQGDNTRGARRRSYSPRKSHQGGHRFSCVLTLRRALVLSRAFVFSSVFARRTLDRRCVNIWSSCSSRPAVIAWLIERTCRRPASR